MPNTPLSQQELNHLKIIPYLTKTIDEFQSLTKKIDSKKDSVRFPLGFTFILSVAFLITFFLAIFEGNPSSATMISLISTGVMGAYYMAVFTSNNAELNGLSAQYKIMTAQLRGELTLNPMPYLGIYIVENVVALDEHRPPPYRIREDAPETSDILLRNADNFGQVSIRPSLG